MKAILAILPLLALPSPIRAADDLPTLAQSQVTMTYPEFRELLDSAKSQTPESAALIDAVFATANYTIDWNEAQTLVEARWQVENFTTNRQAIPVAPASLPVQAVDDAESLFIRTTDHLAVLTRSAGPAVAQGVFAPTITEHGDARRTLHFPILPAATNSLTVRGVPTGMQVEVRGAAILHQSATETTFALSASENEVVLTLTQTDQSTASNWEWRSESLVTSGAASLHFQTYLQATLVDGNSREMQIPIPKDARVSAASSDNLAQWRIETDSEKSQTLVLRWQDAGSPERAVTLEYLLPLPQRSTAWPLAAPTAPDQPHANIFAVVVPIAAEISGEQPTSPREGVALSDWLRTKIGTRSVAIVRSNVDTSVNVTWLPLAESAEVVVRTAKFNTRVVSDGSLLTEAEIEQDSQIPTRWEFQLPSGGQLLRCAVNGKSARPALRGDALELPLDQSSSSQKHIVTYSYTSSHDALDPVAGGITIALPTTETFIHSLTWALELPETYEIAGVESNAEILPPEKNGTLRLQQQLIRATRVSAEIFYSKRGIQ